MASQPRFKTEVKDDGTIDLFRVRYTGLLKNKCTYHFVANAADKAAVDTLITAEKLKD